MSVTIVSPAKTAEPIEMPFGLWTRMGQKEARIRWGAHWRHLANTIESSTCGGDAVFCRFRYVRRSVAANPPGCTVLRRRWRSAEMSHTVDGTRLTYCRRQKALGRKAMTGKRGKAAPGAVHDDDNAAASGVVNSFAPQSSSWPSVIAL